MGFVGIARVTRQPTEWIAARRPACTGEGRVEFASARGRTVVNAPHPRICCLDLDTFFVSVERVLDPSLEGKPVIVGGRPGERGVVTSCSYEVRPLGVRSGMSLLDASRCAPHAVYVPTRHDTYEPYSRAVREIARRYSPVVQVASIDELYMDFGGCERMYRRELEPRGSTRGSPTMR